MYENHCLTPGHFEKLRINIGIRESIPGTVHVYSHDYLLLTSIKKKKNRNLIKKKIK